jgi:glycosyltransferase involved in cell wall biosynthesis
MRVLLSAFQCGPGRGSEPGNGWHWATSLAEYGHEVTVLTAPWDKDAIAAANPPGIDFRFIDMPASALRRVSSRFGTYDVYRRWQEAALRYAERNPGQWDVAHHVTWASLHLGSRLWELPIPFVYGPIGGGQTAPVRYWRQFGRQLPMETFRTVCADKLLTMNSRSQETLRNSTVILVANTATAASARRLGARDIRPMMADGLPAEWLARPRLRPEGVPTVLFVGRLLPHKAPVIAVEAFADLRRMMPARMLIAGEGPLSGAVRAAAERLGVARDVQMLGYVSWDEITSLYDMASVFLFTSLRETFGAPFLEAMGRGLPAVAVDLHGIADVEAGPAAVKVPLTRRPRDLPGQLAIGMRTVLSDPGWETRSKAAVRWASERIWPERAAAASRLYEELVASRADRSRSDG